MTDTRTLSSSSSTTTNHVNGTSVTPTASLPSDLNNVTGLTNYVNTIFQQMEDKFLAASDQVMNRMNELGRKIDTLESNLGTIMSHLPSEESGISDASQQQQQQQQTKS